MREVGIGVAALVGILLWGWKFLVFVFILALIFTVLHSLFESK